MSLDPPELVAQRRARLTSVMEALDVPALLTSDPFSIRYATGTRNMLVHGLTGPDRLALVVADGPTILWEFAGCEHLSAGAAMVTEIRPAPSLVAKKMIDPRREVERFAREVAHEVVRLTGGRGPLGIERLEVPLVDALRERGVSVVDGNRVMQIAMAVKQRAEIAAMRAAVAMTTDAVSAMEQAIEPGRTEQEVWAEFHRALIAAGGELVVTRLLQAGRRTFPYFQEASDHRMAEGDLVCLDTDAVAVGGYSVDFSRTYVCGETEATRCQHMLHALAEEQLEHNASNLRPGRSFEDFARDAFEVPEPYARHGYYQLAHGLGLAGGHPNVPRIGAGPYPLPGEIAPGMVICVESYVGDPVSCQGVKLENQYLVRDDGVELMSDHPLGLSPA